MTLAERFVDAQARVKTLTKAPATAQLLALYALYKQGTLGDATGSRPGMLDLKGRAKYDAWAGLMGRTRDAAMTEYIALVDVLVAA